jgi:hypothetical protein
MVDVVAQGADAILLFSSLHLVSRASWSLAVQEDGPVSTHEQDNNYLIIFMCQQKQMSMRADVFGRFSW